MDSGSLPSGLALAADGTISGTPATAGTSSFQIAFTNGKRKATLIAQLTVSASSSFSITYPQSTYRINTVSNLQTQLPTLHNATPNTPTVFSLSGSGLPVDLGIGFSSGGALWGKANRAGVFQLVIRADNDGRTATTVVNLVITDGTAPDFAYTLPNFVAGQDIGVIAPVTSHVASSEAALYSLDSGALPAGLILGSNGCLSGTPTTVGNYSFTVKLANESRHASHAYAGAVSASGSMALSYPKSLWFKDGTAITTVLPTLKNAPSGSITYTLLQGSLPNGVSLAADGGLKGTPTDTAQVSAIGTYNVSIRAACGGQTAVAWVQCVVTPAKDLALGYPSRILLQNTPMLAVFPDLLNTVPGWPVSFALRQGSLPAGVVLDSDGSIMGSPTSLGTFTATIQADSRGQSASASFTLTVVSHAFHHSVESHWLGNSGGRMGFPSGSSLADQLAWNGNAGNFLTDIGVIKDDNNGGIPTVWVLTQYDETGLGNNMGDSTRPSKQYGAVYYDGQRIGKGARGTTWVPYINSSVSTDAKTGITATIHNYYGRFFNFTYSDFKLSPPPTDATGPYVSLSDGRSIRAVVDPTAVDFDAKGRLWIADNGPDQNIKIFDLSQSLTTPVEIFGEVGGVYAGPIPGQAGDFRFWGPRGIAHDDQGHIYIGCAGMPCLQVGGTDLRMFSSDGKTMLWQTQGCFVQTADADPASFGTEMYTNGKRFTMDYSKAPGQSWKWSGVTLDPFRYPQDPRVVNSHTGNWVRRINGKRFIFMTNMVGSFVGIWRFLDNSEIAIPAGYLMLRDKALDIDPVSPFNNHPLWDDTETNKRIRWFWRDGNGDAAVDTSEFGTWNNWTMYSQGIDVDENGGIWYGGSGPAQSTFGGDGGVQYWPCQGIDANGVPIYDFAHPQHLDVPFTTLPSGQNAGVSRLKYVASTDTMYFGGSGDGYHIWNIYRYDHFLNAAQRKQAFVIDTGFYAACQGTNIHLDTTSWPMTLPWSFTADADYIYVAYVDKGKDGRRRGEVTIYSATDGHEVDFIVPGPEIGGTFGTVDLVNGIFVTTDAQGYKLITEEDDGGAKVVVYRWKP
ncbi:MAG TPA: hypothetical protein PKL14_05295 [Holophaga sp.]|nr:hypothetical protein [Holophaga sp.]